MVNAGVSGETSAGGLRRIGWVLADTVDVLVLELGANDGLRGQDPEALARNLAAIIDSTRTRWPGARIVLAGMEAPPNLGPRYTSAFREVFPRVARKRDAALVPFLLDGVAGERALNQDDGMHPTAAGPRAHRPYRVAGVGASAARGRHGGRPMTSPRGGRAEAQLAFSFPLKVLATAAGLLILALVVGLAAPGPLGGGAECLGGRRPGCRLQLARGPAPLGRLGLPGRGRGALSPGPERGPGATRRWDHQELGDGVFTILATVPHREVRYRVLVQQGSMVTEGMLRLETEGDGTRVTWRERGDFGWNPLLGYLAPSMDRMQGAQMEGALARLARRVAEG